MTKNYFNDNKEFTFRGVHKETKTKIKIKFFQDVIRNYQWRLIIICGKLIIHKQDYDNNAGMDKVKSDMRIIVYNHFNYKKESTEV